MSLVWHGVLKAGRLEATYRGATMTEFNEYLHLFEEGTITRAELTDNAGRPITLFDPNTAAPVSASIVWQASGLLAAIMAVPGLFDSGGIFPSPWQIMITAESAGPGPEPVVHTARLDPGTGTLLSAGPPQVVEWTYQGAANLNVLTEHIPGQQAGVYRLTTTIFWNAPAGWRAYVDASTPDFAGFEDMKLVMVERVAAPA